MVGGSEGDGPDPERREADLERREADLERREAALADRLEAAQVILDAADERDFISDARDDAAALRENELDRAQFLSRDGKHGYGSDMPTRRAAGLDREHAKGDRTAAHDDRISLTQDDGDPGTDEN